MTGQINDDMSVYTQILMSDVFRPLNIPENGKSSHMISRLRQQDDQDLSTISKISCVYQTIF